MEQNKITTLKIQAYSKEMLQSMLKRQAITSAVFEDREVLQMICQAQTESIMEAFPEITPMRMRSEQETVMMEIESDLIPWEKEDYETKVVNQASMIAQAALVDPITKEMYVAIAELKPHLLKTYNLAWCQKESIHFNLMEDRLQEEMSYSQARIQVSEMVIEHVKSL